MSNLFLSFFGTPKTTLDGKTIANFRSAKVQGLLVYLALLAQQAHARDALAALFWPEEAEAVAMKNLRQSLYRLRELLGDEDTRPAPYLLVTRATVQFNPASNYTLDVTSFLAHLEKDQFEPAVALYQGELLAGFSCDSQPFEEWLQTEREKLQRLALHALFELTSRSLARAEYQKAQMLARQQLALEPWREAAHRQLMQALLLLGERNAALAQYEICRTLLAEELDIDPSPETTQLAKRIREAPPVRTNQEQGDDRAAQPQLKMPFVGRKAEFATLRKAYQQASRDGLQLVTVQGKAGIGKTRLTEQFVAWAATQGADVLVGRSFETSGGLSYQPITHLLRQRIERENAPEDLLTDLWLSQLTRLLPELRERYPDLPEPTQEEATAKQHLFEAITRLGKALAERQPLVLWLDDWHWADSASLDMLHYASQRWLEEKAPILLLLTLRQEALSESPALQSWLHQLKRTVSAVHLKVSELSQAETEQLVEVLLTPAAVHDHGKRADSTTQSTLTQFSRWLFTETAGQPLFLTEALKVLVEDGVLRPKPNPGSPSASSGQASAGAGQAVWQLNGSLFDVRRSESRILAGVREMIQGWLTRISAAASDLLMAAAVLAQAASFDNLCRVSGLDESQAVTALDELLKRQLLLETAETQAWARDPVYAFPHQKISEVIYGEAGTARRRLLHRRAFTTLQASGAAAAECVNHALQASLTAESIRYSLIAGNEAMALFAVRVALPHYETAWRIAEQQGWPETVSGADKQLLYSSLGRAYELSDEWIKAEEIYKAMISYAESIGASAMECMGLNQLSVIYYLTFDKTEQAVALLERAKKLAEQQGDQRWLAETELNLAMAAYQNHNHALTLHHAEQALEIARTLDHPHLMARHLSIHAYVYLQQCKWDKLETFAAEASRFYTESGNLVLAAESDGNVGLAQILSGKPREALVTLEKTLAFCRHIENVWGETEQTWKLAITHLELGHYGLASKLAQKGIEMARQQALPSMLALALIAGSLVQRQIMSLTAAQESLFVTIAASKEHRLFAVVWEWTLAELCAAYASAGNWEQAADFARQRLQVREDDSLPMSLYGWYEIEALLCDDGGDLARAEVERQIKIADNNKRYRLPLLRSQAVLAQWDGAVDQAITHLQAALALAQEMGLPGEEWPILGALGRLYAAQGEQAKAQQAYKAAAILIHRLAETIDEETLRVGFLTSGPVRAVLVMSEMV